MHIFRIDIAVSVAQQCNVIKVEYPFQWVRICERFTFCKKLLRVLEYAAVHIAICAVKVQIKIANYSSD